MKKPFISIVIANFNGEKYLKTCLNSVLSSSYKNFEVLLVDDASTDEGVNIVNSFQKRDGRIKLLKNKKNLGAAASRNKAIKKAKGEIFFFLDNDTEIDKNCIHELIKPLVKDESVGAAQSLLLDFKRRDIIQMAGGLLIPQTGWLAPFYQWSNFKKIKLKLNDLEIVAISAALAVKKQILKKIGGFDEKEAVYTEDIDLSWRIWIAGYKILLAPKALVYHHTKSVKERLGMKANLQQIYYHLAKNSVRSILKNYEIKNVLKFLPITIVINLGRGFLVLARSGSFSALVGTLLALWWNLVHLANTIGKRKIVQRTRNFSDKELIRKIFVRESMVEIYNKHFRVVKVLALFSLLSLLFPKGAHAYIDPGSGSYIIQIIIAAFLGVTFTTKMFWKRIKDFIAKILGRDKAKKGDDKDTS